MNTQLIVKNSNYLNHPTLKKNRLKRLQQAKGMCEICTTNRADCVHHKDLTKNNHKLNNLLCVCRKCHRFLHPSRFKISKFKRLYGLSLTEMSERFPGSTAYFRKLHAQNKLEKFLKENKPI